MVESRGRQQLLGVLAAGGVDRVQRVVEGLAVVEVGGAGVGKTVKLPLTVSVLAAALDPSGLRPDSYTWWSGPVAAAVTMLELSSAPLMLMGSLAMLSSPSAASIVYQTT